MIQLSRPLVHIQQEQVGACLVACSAMVLQYIGIKFSQRELERLLGFVVNAGTPSFNVKNLSRLGVSVAYLQGTFEALRRQLRQGYPCIAFIEASELPYHDEPNSHAVVVVGIDEEYVYLHDPFLPTAPIRVTVGDFDLAWLEHDESYAVIRPST